MHEAIPHIDSIDLIRIGHPAGVIDVEAKFADGQLTRVAFSRTARRLMEGYAFVRNS